MDVHFSIVEVFATQIPLPQSHNIYLYWLALRATNLFFCPIIFLGSLYHWYINEDPPCYLWWWVVHGTCISHFIPLYFHCWPWFFVSSTFRVFPPFGCITSITMGMCCHWKWYLVHIWNIIYVCIHIAYLGSFYPACFLFFQPLGICTSSTLTMKMHSY